MNLFIILFILWSICSIGNLLFYTNRPDKLTDYTLYKCSWDAKPKVHWYEMKILCFCPAGKLSLSTIGVSFLNCFYCQGLDQSILKCKIASNNKSLQKYPPPLSQQGMLLEFRILCYSVTWKLRSWARQIKHFMFHVFLQGKSFCKLDGCGTRGDSPSISMLILVFFLFDLFIKWFSPQQNYNIVILILNGSGIISVSKAHLDQSESYRPNMLASVV